jgi:Ca2+-binding EF-hand superfamily protein
MKSAKNSRLTRKELGSVKKLFRLYQDRDGTIDPHEIITSMQTLKLNEKSPVIYELFEEFDTPENSRNRLDYDEFVDLLNEKLSDNDSEKAISRIYEIFLGDSPSETLSFEAIKKVVEDVGDDMSDAQIRELLERATQNGKDMTYEEFHAIMTKKVPA